MFLIFAIAITIFLIQQGILTITRARPTSVPQNVQITNVSDSSFTVVFTTELNTSSVLRLPEGKTGNTIILDDRDKSTGLQELYFSHHITVPNLKPQKTYAFIIISDGKEYDSPAEYIATTGSNIDSPPPAQNPLYGTVILPDGSLGQDTIVTIQSDNSQIISSITNDDGSYIVPMNSLRSEDLKTYQNINDSSQIFLNFLRENYTAKITTDYKLGQNLPVITLNQSYSFLPQDEKTILSPDEGFESIDETIVTSAEPSVISPRQNQSFIDQRPTFSGTGGVNKKMNISILPLINNQTVDISPQGRWTFRPESNLAQGDYTSIFTIQDDNGINTVVTREFSIFPSGSQVAESATPSATPTFSPTPTSTNTPTPLPSQTETSPTPTLIPEVTASPTPTPEVTTEPTTTTNPTLIPTSTPLPPIDSPGDTFSSTILVTFSIVLIVAGAAIFFAL